MATTKAKPLTARQIEILHAVGDIGSERYGTLAHVWNVGFRLHIRTAGAMRSMLNRLVTLGYLSKKDGIYNNGNSFKLTPKGRGAIRRGSRKVTTTRTHSSDTEIRSESSTVQTNTAAVSGDTSLREEPVVP